MLLITICYCLRALHLSHVDAVVSQESSSIWPWSRLSTTALTVTCLTHNIIPHSSFTSGVSWRVKWNWAKGGASSCLKQQQPRSRMLSELRGWASYTACDLYELCCSWLTVVLQDWCRHEFPQHDWEKNNYYLKIAYFALGHRSSNFAVSIFDLVMTVLCISGHVECHWVRGIVSEHTEMKVMITKCQRLLYIHYRLF